MPTPALTFGLIVAAVLAVAAYVFQWFLAPAAMAVWVSVAIWPWYAMLRRRAENSRLLPFLAVSFLAVGLGVPLVFAVHAASTELAQIGSRLLLWIRSQGGGVELPAWLRELPIVGDKLSEFAARGWLDMVGSLSLDTKEILLTTGSIGAGMVEWLGMFLAWLFFLAPLFAKGDAWGQRVRRAVQDRFGARSLSNVDEQVRLMRACFNGIILLGLAEGVAFWAMYGMFDVRQPAFWGLLTGLAASVPLLAPGFALLVCLMLMIEGATLSALAVGIGSAVVLFIVDPIVRPYVAGRGVEIGFLGMMVGMIGGMQSLGMLGIVAGPMVMLALLQLLRAPAPNGAKGAADALPPAP